jgi:atrial natriuretic peptide receptor A
MVFLHASEIRFHGNLKSSNCVVDSRWEAGPAIQGRSTRFVLKLTDFGLHELHARPEGERYSHQFYRSRLWTAPELLRAETNLFTDGPPKKVSIVRKESTVTRGLLARPKPSLVQGTPKADVYSFGIILHEIIVRLGTWGTDIDNRAPEEILAEVLQAGGRPRVVDGAIDPVLLGVMRRAWAEHPHERIDFTAIRQELRKVNKDSKPLMDNLLYRMERYADNLETAVKERTQDYLDEKKKCEDLLYELLPKSVASRLIQGQHVVAETFQSVTIYFSDIVGEWQLVRGRGRLPRFHRPVFLKLSPGGRPHAQ